MIQASDLPHLRRCVELAREALEAGDQPFGSVLVSGDGRILFEDRNRVAGGDHTRHPEFEIARWAATHLAPAERAAATVYTSGEHCPMCAAAHGWVGLGRIVYVSSSQQLVGWLGELGAPLPPAVYRCQRRDSFRVRPPAEDHARCVQRAAPGLERRHPVVDLSAGGLSLHLAAGQPVPQPGTIWRHCRLEAGDSVTIPWELIACAAYEDTGTQAGESGDGEGRAPAAGPAGEPRRRIAFAFHRMPAEVLRAVQRYVIDIERRTRASARE